MIKLITDVMSDPRIQPSIIALLESKLKIMDVQMATHLVLMGMEVYFRIVFNFFKFYGHIIFQHVMQINNPYCNNIAIGVLYELYARTYLGCDL